MLITDEENEKRLNYQKNNGLPLSLEQLVFTPLKELVDDDIVDVIIPNCIAFRA